MKRILMVIVALAALALLTSSLWLSAFGRYLVVDEKPEPSGAIVILSGETVPRVAKGVDLYRQGYADLIVMSGGGMLTSKITDSDLMRMEAVDLGVPPSAVVLEREAQSTYENAVYVKKVLQERKIDSFLLVTSNYHTRRAKNTFGKVFQGTGVKFITVSAPDPRFSASTWWKKHEGQQKALTELANMIVYLVKY